MTSATTLVLLDKDIVAVTGTTDGGLVAGDISSFKASVEFTHTSPATNRVSSAIVKLKIPADGKFARTAPNLMDENAKNNYLIKIQMSQEANTGKEFRGEIGEPTIIQDPNFGEVISIPCESIDRSIREIPVSPIQLSTTPKQRFIKIIEDYEEGRGSTGGTLIGFRGGNADTAIDLPDESQLKQNWIPFGPTKTKKLLNEVMDRLEEAPQAGGKLLDFFYDGDPSATTTRFMAYFAEEFGKNTSGVVIDPTTFGPVGEGAEEKKRYNTDNIVFKNVIIAKADPSSGTTPSELQRFRSNYLNGIRRRLWDPAITYGIGQGVKRQYSGSFPDERYFLSAVTVNLNNDPAPTAGGAVNANWTEDFSIDPSSPTSGAFFSPNPWFSDLNIARSHIVGKGNTGIATYEGAYFDWNIERTLYDRDLSGDFFQRISVKSINKRSDTPPLKAQLYDGYRIILGTFNTGATAIQNGGEGMHLSVDGVDVFENSKRGRVLEYNGDPNGVQGLGSNPKDTDANGWILSDAPVDNNPVTPRTQDMVNDLETMKTLVFDITESTPVGAGDWIDAWDVVADNARSSPFVVCRLREILKVNMPELIHAPPDIWKIRKP